MASGKDKSTHKYIRQRNNNMFSKQRKGQQSQNVLRRPTWGKRNTRHTGELMLLPKNICEKSCCPASQGMTNDLKYYRNNS